MVESVITPFIPPNTVKMVVRMIRPMAPAQKFKPQRYSKKIPPVRAVTLTFVRM